MDLRSPWVPAPPLHDGTRDCGTFLLDFLGQYKPEDLVVHWSQDRPPASAEVQALIERAWTARLDQARQSGTILFDGPLCRLMRFETRRDKLEVTLGPTGYKEFLGTNLTHPQLRYQHGEAIMADPLGVSAAAVTADGYLLLGLRSQKVACYPGRIHPISGTVAPVAGRGPDPFAAILYELSQEAQIPAQKVPGPLCLGMVRDKKIVQPELVFELAVETDLQPLWRELPQAVEAHEHTQIIPLRDHPANVVGFLENHCRNITPVAMATLLLHGLYRWGSGWFAAARGYLRSVV